VILAAGLHPELEDEAILLFFGVRELAPAENLRPRGSFPKTTLKNILLRTWCMCKRGCVI